MTLSIIAALSRNQVIGHAGGLPWKLPADLARFKKLTMGHHLIMGRKTFQSIGRPLTGRTMIVLTRSSQPDLPEGILAAATPEAALQLAAGDDEVFVAGGAEIYRQFLSQADRLYLTCIDADFPGDVSFPVYDTGPWRLVSREDHEQDEKNPHAFSFLLYEKQVSAL